MGLEKIRYVRAFIWFQSGEIISGIVGVSVAPLLHQRLKLGIVPVG
jgi:hypothetical protein